MFLATLTFAGLGWLWLAVGLTGVLLLVLVWSYLTAPSGAWRWVGLALKALGVAALAACLLEPLWSGQRARPGANVFAIVADTSESLQIKDRGESQTRGEFLRSLLGPNAGNWQASLEDHFEVRRFVFDSHLQATRDFQEMGFTGRASALGGALRSLQERFTGRPLAGVLLLTDGNATDLQGVPPGQSRAVPIYPVVIGRAGGFRDVAIARVNVSQTAFEDAPVSLQADVSAAGLGGETVVAQLLDRSGRKLEEKALRARKDPDTLAFRFQWRPDRPGLSFYRLRVGIKDEVQAAAAPAQSQEATLLNNTRVLAVDRGHGPYRILYLAGRPNWEFKFLNRALHEDDQVQLVGLIRVAQREPRFEFLGRAGETSNPLYRGFDNQSRGPSSATINPCWCASTPATSWSCTTVFPARPRIYTVTRRSSWTILRRHFSRRTRPRCCRNSCPNGAVAS